MPCWETIAEALYEIRSGGQLSLDALQLLIEELSHITDSRLKRPIEAIRYSTAGDFSADTEELFSILSEYEEFKREVGKICAEKLLGGRQ